MDFQVGFSGGAVISCPAGLAAASDSQEILSSAMDHPDQVSSRFSYENVSLGIDLQSMRDLRSDRPFGVKPAGQKAIPNR